MYQIQMGNVDNAGRHDTNKKSKLYITVAQGATAHEAFLDFIEKANDADISISESFIRVIDQLGKVHCR